MVRIIAGTLVSVGCGDLPENVVKQMLATGDRRIGGVTAPPQGLILEEVYYYERKPEWVQERRLEENDDNLDQEADG